MSKKILMMGVIAVGLLITILACGCTTANTSVMSKNFIQPDPEIGIVAWMDAINAHDVSGLYNLAPEEIHNQVSLEQFADANTNNTFLTHDKVITGYKILNETSNATMANIKVAVFMQQNVSANSTQTETIPLYLNFEEWFENGQWRVWTIPWS